MVSEDRLATEVHALLLVREAGLTVRDAATVLGVSFQRVSQLTSHSEKGRTKTPAAKSRTAS
jgi:hypothetical protein